MEDPVVAVEKYLVSLIEGIVSAPALISVAATRDHMGVVFSVRTGPDDVGKVIGRAGATATAIRRLLQQNAYKNSIHVRLEFLDVDSDI